jgi:aryl-alcohol dehydrogenase-like predicted oxidoreductase
MKLALGTVQFGLDYGVANASGRVTAQEASNILQRAQVCGMDTLDTAIAYGDSEAVLGQLGIAQWKTITKLPAVPDSCHDVAQWVRDQIQQSMTRLRVTQLHGILLHRPAQLLERMGPVLYAALQSIKSQGMTRKIGISVYSPAELDALFDAYALDLVQAPLNILDRTLVESDWARRLHAAGVEVHTRSVFLQGLLLMPPSQRPAKFNRWADVWNVWDHWLAREGLTPVQACLRYVTNLSQIDRVVVGVDTIKQLNQIVEAAEGKLASLPEFNTLQDTRLINPASWTQLWALLNFEWVKRHEG